VNSPLKGVLMLLLLSALLFAQPSSAAASGVICISPLTPAEMLGTEGKGASLPEHYDDSETARAARIAAAKKREPVVFSVGKVISVPVTERQAACIDGIPFGEKQRLKSNGRDYLEFTLSSERPVRWLTYSGFYSSVALDPLPERLLCPKRSPTPDCSWCPCRSRKYLPPPRP
jgi:hypothetical protein